MTNNIDKQSFGQRGAKIVTDTAAHSGDFCALQLLDETSFTSITWPELEGTFPTGNIPAGTIIYGQISGFTLAYGSVLAYKQV